MAWDKTHCNEEGLIFLCKIFGIFFIKLIIFLISSREDNPVEIIKGFEVINISLIISKLVQSPEPTL